MAESFLVSVHLETVRENFSKSDGRAWSVDEVMAWLVECGFKTNAGLWLVEEISLEVLDKSEYKIVKRL